MIRKFCLYYYIYLLNYATKDLTSTGRMTSCLQGFFTTPLPNQFLCCCINMSKNSLMSLFEALILKNEYVKELNLYLVFLPIT